MVTQGSDREVAFAGSAAVKELASQVFALLRARGRFMAADAPIRVPVTAVAEYLAAQGGEAADAERRVLAMAAANAAVFALEDGEGGPILATTRAGTPPAGEAAASRHSFAQRFLTPLPKPERPAAPVRERPVVDSGWAAVPISLEDLGEEAFEGDLDLEAAPAVSAPTVAPSPAPSAAPLAASSAAPPETLVEAPTAVAPEVEPEVASVEEVLVAEPVAPMPPPARTITIPVITPTDVTGVDDLALASAIRRRLAADPRVANFGEQWMMEDRVPRFSRGDLRRLRDYLQEQEQPLTDDALAQDVLGVRPGAADFELTRFAVDVRLSREKEFEFVGATNQRFWTTTGLPPIGTSRRKPNELGTDYRFLLDEVGDGVEPRSVEAVDHALTFFEYIHGLLPYDADMQRLLPAPLLPNQKTAVFTFECPQSYTTYLVELRFPTPNRGGFILGLDDFYNENLVPGAVLSISRTENDGHYRVEYIADAGQNARLLELEERRQRYVFRPTTFACGVDPTMLLSEERFAGLNGEKPLDEKVRRRPEAVVAATFERVGENREGNYSADFATLLAAVNVERPLSAALLRSTLEHDDTGAFSRDPDIENAYTYVPGVTP
jgi:hypothetical protein